MLANLLALTCLENGQLEEAVALTRECYELSVAENGADGVEALAVLSNLASLLGMQGKTAECEELMLRVVETARRTHGDESPTTIAARVNLTLTRRAHATDTGSSRTLA